MYKTLDARHDENVLHESRKKEVDDTPAMKMASMHCHDDSNTS